MQRHLGRQGKQEPRTKEQKSNSQQKTIRHENTWKTDIKEM